jgi:diguanylate cyclase (GGDEF)-like protein/PAS domain S-box-containing protein
MQFPITKKRLSPYRIRTLIIGAALTIAAIIGTNTIVLMQLYENTLRDSQTGLLRQSLTLSELAERTFQSVDLVLTSVAEKIRLSASANQLPPEVSFQDFHIFLKDKMLGLKQIDALGLIDANGRVLNNTRDWPTPNYDLSEREYFRTLKANPKIATYIGEPIKNKATGTWVINLTRPILTTEGKFLGVAFASTTLAYFEDIFRATSLGEGYAATLMRSDGTLLARFPMAGQIGKVAPASVLQNLTDGRSGVSRSVSPIDHQQRIAAAYKLTHFPLVIVATQNEQVAFAPWRQTAYLMVSIATVLVLTVLIAALLIARSWRQQDRLNLARAEIIKSGKNRALAEAELARQKDLAIQSARFNAAVENMSQGLCMFDASQQLIVCNKRYAELYGLTADQTKSGTELRKILEYRVATGAVPENHDRYISDRIEEVTANKPYRTVNRLKNGRNVSIVHQPMEGGGWVATHEDITEQRRAEQELDDTKKFLDSIIANIPIAVVVKDAKTRQFVLTNRTFEAMVGVPRADLIGKTAFDIYRAGDAERMDKLDRECIERGTGVDLSDFEAETPLLGSRVFATKRIIIRDSQNIAKYIIVVIDDVTERKSSEQRIVFMAHHDALTGLANRVTVVQRIEEAAARQRRCGDSFSVLMLDLDRFKYVNDTLGHPAGDALLREVATRLNEFLRETDVLARLGGDEFAIIQGSEANQREAASALAGRILDLFAKPFIIEGNEVNIGTSIGVALAPEHATDADNLLKMADMALYRTKTAGRNGFRFFDLEMSKAASTRRDLEIELRHAIQNDELVLHYQPIIDTVTRRICGAEALVRWQHPIKGLIAPDRFIPLAEETGLITQIGEWVLHTACAEAATWPSDVKIAVNLSPVQFRKSNLPDVIMYALAQSGLPPERLELEITETALIESAADCLPALRQFKSLGIAVALDDFGTGYSSLGQLTMFHFDKIKIDKSFTQNMTKRAECAAIISATLTLAHSLGIETTAEGVETADQYRLLRLSGVTSLQGYLFKRPGPASNIEFEHIYGDLEMVDAA